jgi:hypothetical protein
MTKMVALKNMTHERPLNETEMGSDIRYMWVDEDSKPIKPDAFRDFGAALTWYRTWAERKYRLEQRIEKERSSAHPAEWLIQDKENELARLSLTGKPPHKLYRIVIQASVQEIDEAEAQIVSTLQGMG